MSSLVVITADALVQGRLYTVDIPSDRLGNRICKLAEQKLLKHVAVPVNVTVSKEEKVAENGKILLIHQARFTGGAKQLFVPIRGLGKMDSSGVKLASQDVLYPHVHVLKQRSERNSLIRVKTLLAQ